MRERVETGMQSPSQILPSTERLLRARSFAGYVHNGPINKFRSDCLHRSCPLEATCPPPTNAAPYLHPKLSTVEAKPDMPEKSGGIAFVDARRGRQFFVRLPVSPIANRMPRGRTLSHGAGGNPMMRSLCRLWRTIARGRRRSETDAVFQPNANYSSES